MILKEKYFPNVKQHNETVLLLCWEANVLRIT